VRDPELSAEQRRTEMDKIQTMFARAKQNGDDKVSIAIQTYELVDKHIRKLDSDLAKFEAEMKEKGRLSQTETEGDDDDDEEDEGDAAGKKKKGKNSKAVEKRKSKKAEAESAADKKNKKKRKNAAVPASTASSKSSASEGASAGGPLAGLSDLPPGLLNIPQEVLDMPVDPNEPTYCLCQQVSYGEMIGCDNADCPIEWFHFGCMSLTTKPKGKWYCPKCITQFKKKK
jgi:inhibitor of growth protein 4